jgi:hypothetical protein
MTLGVVGLPGLFSEDRVGQAKEGRSKNGQAERTLLHPAPLALCVRMNQCWRR